MLVVPGSRFLRLSAVGLLLVACGCRPAAEPARPPAPASPAAQEQQAPADDLAPPASPPSAPWDTPAPPAELPATQESPPTAIPSGEEPHVNPLRAGEPAAEGSSLLPSVSPAFDALATAPATPAVTVVAATEPAKKTFGQGKHSGEPFDPIQVNGPVFVDWPQPAVALVLSGRQDGYLEPCGCAGLERMKGGLSRRYSFLADLRKKGWPLVALDVGGAIKGYGRQAEFKFHMTIEALRNMGYQGIVFGQHDLQLPVNELISEVASVPKEESPFVAANVEFQLIPDILNRTQIVQAGGWRIGITSVLGQQLQNGINNPGLGLSDPKVALAKVLPELKGKAEVLILLAHATVEESQELARQFPEFQIIVTSGGPPSPPLAPIVVEGTKTLLIEVAEKAMDVVVLGLYDTPPTIPNPVVPLDVRAPGSPKPGKLVAAYQVVPMDSRYANSSEVRMLMAAYQDNLKMLGLEGLGLRPVPGPQKESHGDYVGSAKCAPCHEPSYDVWKKSGHARAWDTLLTKTTPPRDGDPECISCHVIGWNPIPPFPYESGFWSAEKTPHLENVGCESCHGPGSRHVAAEMGGDGELKKQLQKTMVVTKEESEKHLCTTCHDLDNSPHFNFKDYWPQVEHSEK